MLIKVRVKAGAKNESVKRTGETYYISVREKAAAGMANARVLELLARELRTPVKKLRIVKGHRSPAKIIESV